MGLECEIGVVVDGDGRPVSAGPVIEVPRLRPSGDSSAAALIVGNIGSHQFIRGEQKPIRDSYTDIIVTLTCNGNAITSGTPLEALGGPLEALEWMVGEARERGLPVRDGMLMITGAIGGLKPAEPGEYVADFGDLGQIGFTVE